MTPDDAGRLAELQTAVGPRYTLHHEVGRGGMATVYLARDERDARDVALKVLHGSVGESLGTDRFLREIQLAGRLVHPHILPLLDSGRVGAVPFYVMPYVSGESLSQRLQRERLLPVPMALGIAVDVLAALGYAHSTGVIHRDIKPDNIMLSASTPSSPLSGSRRQSPVSTSRHSPRPAWRWALRHT